MVLDYSFGVGLFGIDGGMFHEVAMSKAAIAERGLNCEQLFTA